MSDTKHARLRNEEIIKVLQENIDLPNLVFVSGQMTAEWPDVWYGGALYDARVAEVAYWEDAPDTEAGRYVDKYDIDEIRDYYRDEEMNDDEIDRIIDGMHWERTILLRVDVC